MGRPVHLSVWGHSKACGAKPAEWRTVETPPENYCRIVQSRSVLRGFDVGRMTQPPTISAQARLTLHDAFERFSQTVSVEDRRQFDSTMLEDVRGAALQIERQLAAQRSLRYMRRLEPFLRGLEQYSKSIDVLCNGTPYLPWVWVSPDCTAANDLDLTQS